MMCLLLWTLFSLLFASSHSKGVAEKATVGLGAHPDSPASQGKMLFSIISTQSSGLTAVGLRE